MAISTANRLALALCISAVGAIHQGALKIDMEGKTLELHVVAMTERGKYFSTHDRAVTLRHGGEIRGFLAGQESDKMSSDSFFNFSLLDKELSYDVDLSSVGCSCNAALFFVTMPGYNEDGTVARGNENPYYCDANQMGGVWCWEHDTIEANRHAVATTAHTCDTKPGTYIGSCDKIGCSATAFEANPEGMCPSEDCDIDTRRPFRIHQRFEGNSRGRLVRIVNRFTQEGRSFGWESCHDHAYLEKMTAAFASQMTMVFQLWGSTEEKMSWLDGVTGCKGACDANATEVTFSDIAIRSLPPLPPRQEDPLSSGHDVVVV